MKTLNPQLVPMCMFVHTYQQGITQQMKLCFCASLSEVFSINVPLLLVLSNEVQVLIDLEFHSKSHHDKSVDPS